MVTLIVVVVHESSELAIVVVHIVIREGLIVKQLVLLERHHAGAVKWAHHSVTGTAIVVDLQLFHLRDLLLRLSL